MGPKVKTMTYAMWRQSQDARNGKTCCRNSYPLQVLGGVVQNMHVGVPNSSNVSVDAVHEGAVQLVPVGVILDQVVYSHSMRSSATRRGQVCKPIAIGVGLRSGAVVHIGISGMALDPPYPKGGGESGDQGSVKKIP